MITSVGVGLGDSDLITIRGRKTLEKADIIIYVGPLVSSEYLIYAKETCEIYNSAKMHLDEVLDAMVKGDRAGKEIVRLHTGGPSIYGAIQEQMDPLERLGIGFEAIPGVSSSVAAVVAIKKEFTLPNVSQTVILTRVKGWTDVPESENLESSAAHGASMALSLNVGHIEKVIESLIRGYGRGDVPVAVVYRATWKDEKKVSGILRDICQKVQDKSIIKQVQILVGDLIDTDYELFKLYDKYFTVEYRQGVKR